MDAENQPRSNLGGITGKGFMPGQSGNPGGRPKGKSIASRMRDLLEAHELGGKRLPNNKQVADLVAEALVRGAVKGDPRILAMLLDRVEGKVPDVIHQVNADEPRRITVAFADDRYTSEDPR